MTELYPNLNYFKERKKKLPDTINNETACVLQQRNILLEKMSQIGLRIFIKIIYSRRANNNNISNPLKSDLFNVIDFLYNNNLITFTELVHFSFYKPNFNNSMVNLKISRVLSSDSSLKDKEKEKEKSAILCDISNDSKKYVSSIDRKKILDKRSKQKKIFFYINFI